MFFVQISLKRLLITFQTHIVMTSRKVTDGYRMAKKIGCPVKMKNILFN
jgi:hypothetical protein